MFSITTFDLIFNAIALLMSSSMSTDIILSIEYLLNHPEMAVFIKYDDLVVNPEKELRKVYKFLNLPYYPHTFTNLKQVVVNGMPYDDSFVGKNMHTIRTEKIVKVENEYKKTNFLNIDNLTYAGKSANVKILKNSYIYYREKK